VRHARDSVENGHTAHTRGGSQQHRTPADADRSIEDASKLPHTSLVNVVRITRNWKHERTRLETPITVRKLYHDMQRGCHQARSRHQEEKQKVQSPPVRGLHHDMALHGCIKRMPGGTCAVTPCVSHWPTAIPASQRDCRRVHLIMPYQLARDQSPCRLDVGVASP